MYYIIIFAIVLIDQATKAAVRSNLEINQSVAVLEGVLNFTYIHNFGAAFSILQHKQIFLISLTAVISAVILVMLVKNMKYAHWRIKDGYFIDFLEITLFSFPVFNIADIAVVGGSILLIINIIFFDKALKVDRNKNAG